MRALIDADILLYRVGFTTEGLPEGIAKARMDETIDRILTDLLTDEYTCFLSPTGQTTFRYEIYPDYKATRVARKPEHYTCLREHILECHPAMVAQGEEADDLIGKEATGVPEGSSVVVVSIDKDLKQIPGDHYQFVKQERFTVTELEGLKHFYKQMLIGDTVDNIPGIHGIGEKKAGGAIDGLGTESECYNVTLAFYRNQYSGSWADVRRFYKRAADLFWIRKTGREEWQPPINTAQE